MECDDLFFALGDTIVCEDLKEAEWLAFGKPRRRVVTLDGNWSRRVD